MKAILSVASVTVKFGGLTALDNVSLEVNPGELLSLIGPNGAGKTTLLNAVIGKVIPVTASVRLQGKAVQALPTHKRIRMGMAMTHQIVRPFTSMTVLENVAFAAGYKKVRQALPALFRLSRTKERKTAQKFLDMVGISDFGNDEVSTLPLGVLKRLEVARALAVDPKVLLLDEPLAGLNSQEARQLADTVRHITDQGLTVVMIEHNLSEVMRISDRLHVLDNGRNLADGNPVNVMNRPDVRAAYLGGGPDA